MPSIVEATLFEFLDRGYYDAHLRKIQGELDARSEGAIAELERVLKPGGTIAVTVPAWLAEQLHQASGGNPDHGQAEEDQFSAGIVQHLNQQALGGKIEKLKFGHHGGNHPVRDVTSGRIDITSQNHNFAVDPDSLGGIAEMTHVNLNDGVCEGMRLTDANAWSVQHHPEAGPGPHDAAYLFDEFERLMDRGA